MNIYDKAKWQIDSGMPKEKVLAHFVLIFEWLHSKNMLSKEGIEMLEAGMDDSISLNEEMVTEDGNAFLLKYYDNLISSSNYSIDAEKKLINSYFEDFVK